MHIRQSTLAVMLIALATLGGGGIARAGTPEEFVKEYMMALQTRGFVSVPEYIHPDELARFKEMLMPMIRKEAAAGKKEITQGLFGPEATLASVEAMSGADFMSGLLRLVGEKLEGFKVKDAEVLGSVREKDIVHVVSRVGVDMPEGMSLRQMDVVSVRADGKGWKLLLSGQLEGLAAAFSAQ
jgi:hypothetical protein